MIVLNGTQLERDGENLRPDGSCPKCERINERIQVALTTHAHQRYVAGLRDAAQIAETMATGETYETGRQKALNIAAAINALLEKTNV